MKSKSFFRDDTEYSYKEMELLVAEEVNHLLEVKTGRKAEAMNLGEVGPAQSVLDIGCEIGTFLVALKKLFGTESSYDGVDVNATSIAIAKEFCAQHGVTFTLHGSEKLPFKNETFDRVFALEVLEHIRNVDLSLKEINRIMKPSGILIISVPNSTALKSLIKSIVLGPLALAKKIESWPKFAPDQRDHVNNYDFLHLYRILNLNGFKFRQIRYTGWSYPWVGKFPT